MGKKVEDEEEMVIVGPISEDDEDEHEDDSPEHEDEDEGEEDSDSPRKKPRKKKSSESEDEDGDSDEDDDRVGHGEDDEEDGEGGKSKKRERESRKDRRERQKKARLRNEIELNFLRQQNEQLERQVREINQRLVRTETGTIDTRIQQIQAQLKVADQVLAKAHESGSGEDVVEATNIRDKLREGLSRLSEVKQVMARRQQDEPQIDSRLVRHAQTWMSENRWYNPQGSDKDSQAVAAIDDRLVQEGFDPSSPDYWEELTRRVRRRLPHRFRGSDADDDDDFDDDEDSRPRRKGKRGNGPRFSTGGRERPLRRNEVYISPERKQAMIDAGVWDDPVLRQRYLKTYAKYDRENRGQH